MPWRRKLERMPVRSPNVGDLRRQRRHEAVVVERGRAQLAREMQQLLHRLRGERLRLAQLLLERGRRVADRGRQAQQDRGQRLVDLVVQVLRDPRALDLLGAQDGAAGLAPLVLEPLEHAVEVGRQAADLVGGAARDVGALAGSGEVDAAHRLHQAAHRLEPAAQQDAVEQHDDEDAQRDQQQALDAGRVLEPVTGDDRGDERRDGHEYRVDPEDLRKQRARAHPPGTSAPLASGLMVERTPWRSLSFLKH